MNRAFAIVATKTTLTATALSCVLGASAAVQAAASGGVADTDRFGYNGTIERYPTLDKLKDPTEDPTDTITVTDRDLSLFMANNDPAGKTSDANIALGSWWYTTDSQGRAAWGNTRGNTGVGFMQLFDADGSTDTNVDMSFDNFDGTYYTDFHLTVEGENANSPDDFSRLSAIDNTNDGGIWHEYAFNMTAFGLEGQQTDPGVIQSINQPTGVSGTISGIFEITENQTSPANQGFYVVDFDLSMINWAWENRNDLMTQDDNGNAIKDTFAPSTFRAVPEPASVALMGLGGVALLARRRRV